MQKYQEICSLNAKFPQAPQQDPILEIEDIRGRKEYNFYYQLFKIARNQQHPYSQTY